MPPGDRHAALADIFSRARARFAAGDVAGASALCQALLKEAPAHPQALHLHGVVMLAVGRLQEARTSLNRALEKRPSDPLVLNDLAQVYLREDRYDDARRTAERAVRANPTHPLALAMLGEVAYTQGDFDAAWKAVAGVEGDASPPIAVAIAYAKVCRRFDRLERGIDLLSRALEVGGLPRAYRKSGLFVLGELLDAAHEYDRAFKAIKEGRALNRVEGAFDWPGFLEKVGRMRSAWTRDLVIARAADGDASTLPVFVLGMWRSGTTLVEQIVASHPRAHGAGELFELGVIAQRLEGRPDLVPMLTRADAITPGALKSAAREYLAALRKRSPSAARITDKMPTNFLHMGLIAAMLPGASVIRCERDARDVCLSCYFNLPGDRAHYSDDLRTLGQFYRASETMMDWWMTVTPRAPHRVRYEALIADAETESRRLLSFIGLEWDPICLRFFENKRVARTASLDQVRRPMYSSSIGRWRNYEGHLGPLLEALGL